jgi:NAD(P)-dependent dehydrogenase (short-subunit alcohol dehydrogenase family)
VLASDLSADTLQQWRTRWDTDQPHRSLLRHVADVADEGSLAALAADAEERLGTVDVLINAAGHFPQNAVEDITGDEWRRVIEINLNGTFYTIKALLPLIKNSTHGRIINIGSGGMFFGVPRQAHYIAAKAGVMGLTRVLARELGNDHRSPSTLSLVAPSSPRRPPRSCPSLVWRCSATSAPFTATDVIGSVFFLASDDAAFNTGRNHQRRRGLTM